MSGSGPGTDCPTARHAVAAFLSCAAEVIALLWRRQLACPRGEVGRWVAFADGTRSQVYRETRRLGASTSEPVALVVAFRLRLVRTNPLLHAAFRVESQANTLLFAGFPGFRSKLWLTDHATGWYRGLYDWDGAGAAEVYARTLCRLLRLLCEPGTVRYHIVPGLARDALVCGAAAAGGDGDRWWRVLAAAEEAR